MNFKLLVLLFIVSSCGVKGDPTTPNGQTTPSVLDNYKDIEIEQPLNDTSIKKK